jgi:DNA invertase Pin-like site-specific DNA recombinase
MPRKRFVTDKMLELVRDLRRDRISYSAIARAYGISDDTVINYLVCGNTY